MSPRASFGFTGTVDDLRRASHGRLGEPEQPSLPIPLSYRETMPDGARMALLLIRKGSLANRLVAHWREQHGPEPEKSDWRELIAAGYIARKEGRLQITPPGLWAAQDVMRDLSEKFGIHHVDVREGRTGISGHSATCTCGWRIVERRTFNGLASVGRGVAEHEMQARTGMLPRAYVIPRAGAS